MDVKVIRCRRKSIAMRMDGEDVLVRAPLYISEKELDVAIKDMLPRLMAKVKRSEAKRAKKEDGYYYLGKCYTPEIRLGEYNRVELVDNKMVITHTISKSVEDVYAMFMIKETKRIVEEILDVYLPRFPKMQRPNLVVKRVKSKWGSYAPKRHTMMINWALLFCPLENVKEVVCHELCHEFHLDHSPAFHDLLERIYPNHRERERGLHAYGGLL